MRGAFTNVIVLDMKSIRADDGLVAIKVMETLVERKRILRSIGRFLQKRDVILEHSNGRCLHNQENCHD